MAPIVHIDSLGLAFEQDGQTTEVLRGLTLDIARGEFLCIVGTSGVGKSTLLRVLIGLAQPTAGRVTVAAEGAGQTFGFVFQDARLLPWRRVWRNVAFGLERTGMSRAAMREKALGVLAFVGLGDLADRFPHQLSGGQRQRVALARALAIEPKILLMDEPFSALDAPTRESLQDEISRIARETGKTILFVTHDIDEAVYLGDRVVALGGRPGELKATLAIDLPRPRSREDAALIGLAAQVKRELFAQHGRRDDWEI